VIRACATIKGGGLIVFFGLTDVNLQRLSTGGDEGVGRPMDIALADFVPEVAETTPIGNVRLVVFHATRESIIELGKALDQDVKGMLDQLGEG
jgi:hypothetical protein